MTEIIVLHGAPGSGKTTLAQKFTEMHPNDVSHISIGNHLRMIRTREVESNFKENIDAQADALAQSEPLDHQVVTSVVFEFIQQCPSMATVLIDGFPRFVEQLPLFWQSIELGNHLCLGLILLNITESTCISRLTNRGARRGEREVNTDFAQWRFQEYEKQTFPTIATLGAIAKLIEINAEQLQEEVWTDFNQSMLNLINTSAQI